ncbi:MAG: GntR family transcriptional regulator, partial [Lentisphaerota bacterium]
MKSKSKKYAYELVASDIVNRIGKGEWTLGARIPAVETLVSQYPYSHMTVFKALKHLETRGILEMKRGSGVYVAKTGRQFTVGMLFYDTILRAQKTPFNSLIMEAGKRYCEKRSANFEIFITDNKKDEFTCRDFITALKNRTIDGFMALGIEPQLKTLTASQFWNSYSIPYLNITGDDAFPCTVKMDFEEEAEMAFKYISSRGIRKVDVLGADLRKNIPYAEIASKYGLSLLLHPFSLEITVSAFQEERHELFGLVMGNKILSREKLPEAILVLDDIMAKGVALELFKRGVKIPEEMLFVTHSNKGSGVFYPVPAVKVEFDPDKIVEAAGNMLWNSMTKGTPLAGSVRVPPELCAAETTRSI